MEWPDSAFATPSGPLVICVVGESPFRGLLDRAARNQTAHGRAMQVRHLERVTQESGCHIVFASGSSRQSIAEVLDAVRESPVLTVTDNQRRGGRAGIIDFVLQDDRVQFSIDDKAATAHDLRISSRLLSLAVSVNPRLG